MMQRSTGECPGSECWRCGSRSWLCSARCLFSRSRHLVLAITVVGVLMVLISINFSTTVHDKPAMEVSLNERLPPYAVDNRISEESNNRTPGGQRNPPMMVHRKRRRHKTVLNENLEKQLRMQTETDGQTSGDESNPSTTVHMETRKHVTIFTKILQKHLRMQTETGQMGCIHPRLDLKHDANQFAYHDMPPLNCTGQGLFYSQNGVLVLNTSVVESPSLLGECAFYHIKRVNDWVSSYASYETKKSPSFETSFPHDFARIRCVLNSTLKENKNLNVPRFVDPHAANGDFDQFIVQVHPKPHVFQRIAQAEAVSQGKESMRLNVLMFALDSMSHLSSQRKLPQTYRFLKEELGAAILENYNIVGDATTAAIIPMFTGYTEMDLPDVRKSTLTRARVDEYPMIWKRFREEGYATLFAEDKPIISVFNGRLKGFRDPPTDHYMRTFWLSVLRSSLRRGSKRFCTGNTPNHQFMLTYMEDFFIKYNNVSRFAFGFHVELSHDDNNPAQYIDSDLVGFLRRLRQQKILEDTVLIIFGDHGARYSKVRSTVQGKLEERLPLMSLAFPRKFRQRYPDLHHNLMTNTQRLSTPFDIHETLLDISDLSGIGRRESIPPGISLLREIPVERTCEDAGIGMHWCTCLHQVRLDPEDEFVKPVTFALIWYLNAQVHSKRQQCARLELAKVLSVFMVLPNEMVLKYQRSSDRDRRMPHFSPNIDLDVAYYQLQVETQPCGALYEATVMAKFHKSTYEYSVTSDVSRINEYGSQPSCVQDRFPMLRKFCCCLDYLEKNGRT